MFLLLLDWREVSLWYSYGNQGNKWTSGKVNLFNHLTASKTSRVVISGIRGSDYTGDIAIDDIKFHNCDFKDDKTPCGGVFDRCNDKPIAKPTLGE